MSEGHKSKSRACDALVHSAAKRTAGGVLRVTCTDAAVVGNRRPELEFKTLDVYVVAVTETWLGPREGDNELMSLDYLFFRLDRADGRKGGGTLILLAEKYDAQEGYKLHTPNIQAIDVKIATGRSRISFLGVNRGQESSPAEDGEVFPFLSVAAAFTGNLLILEYFYASGNEWVCGTVPKGTFGLQLLQFAHVSGIILQVTQATQWRFGQVSPILDVVLTGTPNYIWSLELERSIVSSENAVFRMRPSRQGLVAFDKFDKNFSGMDKVRMLDLGL